jgi:uncharacterized protein (DUF433 family)
MSLPGATLNSPGSTPRRLTIIRSTDRFETPLYSVSEAARYVGVPATTFTTWLKGYARQPSGRSPVVGAPIVSAVRTERGLAVPFIGLAEGLVLAAFRRAGVPLQRIRPALDRLQDQLGIEHALAAKATYTDGAEILYDFAEQQGDTVEARSARELVVVRNDQRVFADVVDAYLHRVEFAADGYARLIRLPGYRWSSVVADPSRSFGQPVFEHGGARVEDVLARFQAGEPLDVVSAEFGVPPEDLEDALRVATRQAA